MVVRDLMSTPAVSVDAATPLREVARLLRSRSISGVPVVADGRVVGVVSVSDIVRKEAGRLEAAETAADAMTAPATVVEPWVSDYGAARLLTERDVSRLPVVQHGRLVGVLSRSDVLRVFTRSDSKLADAIRHEALEPLEPLSVLADVRDGHVTLTGVAADAREREAVRRSVACIPGVVSVEARVEVQDR